MADRTDAKVLEILSRQTRQHIAIDIIVAEDRLVLLEPEPVEPCRNIHARLPAGSPPLSFTLQGSAGCARGIGAALVRASTGSDAFSLLVPSPRPATPAATVAR